MPFLSSRQITSIIEGLSTALKGLSSSFPPELERDVRRISSVADFLAVHSEGLLTGTLSGRELALLLCETRMLRKEVQADLLEILDEEEGRDIEERVFGQSALLLLVFHLLEHSPDDLIGSPQQTINFKFGELTLICRGTQELVFFNRRTCEEQEVPLSNVYRELQRLLRWTVCGEREILEQLIIPTVIYVAIALAPTSYQGSLSHCTL
jgi:hypothetical protein